VWTTVETWAVRLTTAALWGMGALIALSWLWMWTIDRVTWALKLRRELILFLIERARKRAQQGDTTVGHMEPGQEDLL
jgi:hypothetical protein